MSVAWYLFYIWIARNRTSEILYLKVIVNLWRFQSHTPSFGFCTTKWHFEYRTLSSLQLDIKHFVFCSDSNFCTLVISWYKMNWARKKITAVYWNFQNFCSILSADNNCCVNLYWNKYESGCFFFFLACPRRWVLSVSIWTFTTAGFFKLSQICWGVIWPPDFVCNRTVRNGLTWLNSFRAVRNGLTWFNSFLS